MTFSDLTVGQSASLSRTISEADIARYAELTGDFNPVHLDPAWAAQSRFEGRIAHGMLTAGLISAVLGMKLPGTGAVYLSQSLKFVAPVRIGDTITARAEVLELLPPKQRVRLATICTNQHGKIVLEGEALLKVDDVGSRSPYPSHP